ncbi:hypothetical protein Metev_1082 [Methanohalobium evestigatum Z-7303]|uniref:EF-hand domain-containing protein n=1 Tax=Methanohalobium evestigatum (strain ATCC BAA-1072 / DSM 3721 / NBRC 107634 / OCM 161 / Z-7303) TaxID=644295 RepID=D7E920_METEZ|nr:hypothetical protein [Methanohalobium evestigatum]ADI73968.1 hypothetical protein Metev_1082 [Methanohalobium evestigatum Z-7303]
MTWTASKNESDISKYHSYDSNQDYVIDRSELSKAINDYYAGKLSFKDISQIIDYWQLGSEGYC